MKSKSAFYVVAALGLMAAVASALGQQSPDTRPDPFDPGPKLATASQDLPAARFGQDTVHGSDKTSAARYAVDALNVARFQSADKANVPFVIAGHPHSMFALSSEEAGLTQSAEQLAHQLSAAKSDSERDKIKVQLVDVLEKQFDLRQRRHTDEIAALEAQVKKLRSLVEKRQENRREIVAKRLDQILSDAQGLGW
jgi:hypothetical protein